MPIVTSSYALVGFSKGHLQLLAGDHRGRDEVHQIVATWPGWSRLPTAATLPNGQRSSVYRARPWVSSIVPLLEQQHMPLSFKEGVEERLRAALKQLVAAKVELDPPKSHHAPLKWTDEWLRQPMPHQVMAVRALGFMHYRALLADDMGLGKTATAIWSWQQAGAPRALVICPKTVKRNWAKEVDATLKDVTTFVVDGTTKQRANVFGFMNHAMEHLKGRGIAILNYDQLVRLPPNEKEALSRWTDGQFLILDESHYVKGRKTARTKFVLDELAGASCILALTGTPVRNTLEDLWAQLHIVRPGIWASYSQFDKFHLVKGKASYEYNRTADGESRVKVKQVVRATTRRESLNAVVNTCQVRRKKEDVLDLPPKTFTYPEFELDEQTQRVYDQMRDFALIELADLGPETPIFAPGAKSALEATLRLEQIAQGFLGGIPDTYLEKVTPLISKIAVKIPGRPGHVLFPQSAKIEWLQETIETVIKQGGQPLIFSRFNSPMFWFVEQWKDAQMLHGGLSLTQRETIIERFQKGGTKVLFCQIKLGEGWNATSSQDVILYGRDWSPAVNAQAVDRVHRIGQRGTVNVQIPIVAGTFELYLHRKLAAKQSDADVALKSMTVGELTAALLEAA